MILNIGDFIASMARLAYLMAFAIEVGLSRIFYAASGIGKFYQFHYLFMNIIKNDAKD